MYTVREQLLISTERSVDKRAQWRRNGEEEDKNGTFAGVDVTADGRFPGQVVVELAAQFAVGSGCVVHALTLAVHLKHNNKYRQ